MTRKIGFEKWKDIVTIFLLFTGVTGSFAFAGTGTGIMPVFLLGYPIMAVLYYLMPRKVAYISFNVLLIISAVIVIFAAEDSFRETSDRMIAILSDPFIKDAALSDKSLFPAAYVLMVEASLVSVVFGTGKNLITTVLAVIAFTLLLCFRMVYIKSFFIILIFLALAIVIVSQNLSSNAIKLKSKAEQRSRLKACISVAIISIITIGIITGSFILNGKSVDKYNGISKDIRLLDMVQTEQDKEAARNPGKVNDEKIKKKAGKDESADIDMKKKGSHIEKIIEEMVLTLMKEFNNQKIGNEKSDVGSLKKDGVKAKESAKNKELWIVISTIASAVTKKINLETVTKKPDVKERSAKGEKKDRDIKALNVLKVIGLSLAALIALILFTVLLIRFRNGALRKRALTQLAEEDNTKASLGVFSQTIKMLEVYGLKVITGNKTISYGLETVSKELSEETGENLKKALTLWQRLAYGCKRAERKDVDYFKETYEKCAEAAHEKASRARKALSWLKGY